VPTHTAAPHHAQVFAQEIEHKKVVRALVREVGEETPLSKVLEEGSDWKGRREQLIALRDQVKALKSSQVGGPACGRACLQAPPHSSLLACSACIACVALSFFFLCAHSCS